MEKIFTYFYTLFETFGFWCFALVGATFLIMVPINFGVTKLFALFKEVRTETQRAAFERVRKVVSSLLVFAVAATVITLFSLWHKDILTAEYVFSNCLLIAPLAMLVRAFYKIVRDNGIKPLIAKLSKSKEFQKWFNTINISDNLKNEIFERVDRYINEAQGENIDIIMKEEVIIINDITNKLNGFVKDPQNVAKQFVDCFKNKYKK